LATPSCPVERAERPCPPRPVPGATVEVRDASGLVSATSTDAAGRFSLVVPGGSYQVRATNAGGYRSTAEQQVQVAPGAVASVRLVVDSGIR
ncbi:MAG TPA: carboxypeptidase-like regulatory domain-containing protein, partial [Actinomycetes bacterium]